MKKQNFDYDYEVLKTFALTHNYNKWIIDLIQPYIKGNILEVGCGIGNLTSYLCELGELTCIDVSPVFIKHMEIDYPEVEFVLSDISDKKILSLNKKFSTIVCINVLEHIKDDDSALRNMYDLLDSQGYLLLYVPALDKIYGSMDINLGHWRRYNKKVLSGKLESIGFKIEKIMYNNLLGILGWYVNSKILKRNKFSILQPLIFDKIIPLLAKCERIIKPPIGMSILAIVKKI